MYNCSLCRKKKKTENIRILLVVDKAHFRQVSMRCNEMTPEGEFILTFEGNRLSRIIEVRLRWQDNNKNMKSIKRLDVKESCERSLKFRSLQLEVLSQSLKATLTQKQRVGEGQLPHNVQ